MKNEDFIGLKVNLLTVLSLDPKTKPCRGREARFICVCDCGNILTKSKTSLKTKSAFSCGCERKIRYDLTGKKFNKLQVIEISGSNNHGELEWKCLCDCGNTTIVPSYSLRMGSTRSCGCLKFEERGRHILPNYNKIYEIRTNMINRCYNEKTKGYDIYGKAGITICEEWLNDPVSFYEWSINNGYEKGLSIDRIDGKGNYEPSNCRWVTWTKQCNNRKTNVFLTRNGETKTMAEWSRELNVKYWKIQDYVKSGKDFNLFEV